MRLTKRLEGMRGDVRLAVRQLMSAPGFTLVATLILALGIGVNSAIFSLVDAALMRPLPFGQAERLVMLWERRPTSLKGGVSPLNMRDWSLQSRSFEGIAAVQRGMGGGPLIGVFLPVQRRRLRPLLLDSKSRLFEEGAPAGRILPWMVPKGVRREQSRHPVDIHNQQQELTAGFEDACDLCQRFCLSLIAEVIDDVRADHGVEHSVAVRQGARVAPDRLRAMGGSGDSRICHEPFGCVVLDAHVALIEIEPGDGCPGPREQYADGCPAGSCSNVQHTAAPRRKEPLRRKLHRPVDPEHHVDEDQADNRPYYDRPGDE
jgi:hypothetical protein